MADNIIKVVLQGIDKSLSRSLKGAGKQADATSSRFGAMSKKLKIAAAGAVAGLAGGFYALKRTLDSCLSSAGNWMGGLAKMQRLTGMSAEQVSVLNGQFKLTGIDSTKGATGIKLFQKNLYAARTGMTVVRDKIDLLDTHTAKYQENLDKLKQKLVTSQGAFAELGVAVQDENGNWRDSNAVLADVRDRFSQLEDPTARAALALKLFGRSGADMLPWLTKSKDELDGLTADIKKFGMFSDKDIKTYKEFVGNQRLMAYMWDMLKVKAGLMAMTLMNKVWPAIKELYSRWVPRVQKVIERLAGWIEDHMPVIMDWFGKAQKVLGFIADHAVAIGAAFVGWKISKGVVSTIAALKGLTTGGTLAKLIKLFRTGGSSGGIGGGAGGLGKAAKGGGLLAQLGAWAVTGTVAGPALAAVIAAAGAATVVYLASKQKGPLNAAGTGRPIVGTTINGKPTGQYIAAAGHTLAVLPIPGFKNQQVIEEQKRLQDELVKHWREAGKEFAGAWAREEGVVINGLRTWAVKAQGIMAKARQALQKPIVFRTNAAAIIVQLEALLRKAQGVSGALARQASVALSYATAKKLGISHQIAHGVRPMASGGIVSKPTLALIGESGPEAVVPLRRGVNAGPVINLTVPIYMQGAVIGSADQVGEAIGKLVVPHLRKLARVGAF